MSSNAHFLIYFSLYTQCSTLQAISSLRKNASVFIGGDFLIYKSLKIATWCNTSIPHISFHSYLVNKLTTCFCCGQHYTANRAARQQVIANSASSIIKKFASHRKMGFLSLLLMADDENQHRSRLLVSELLAQLTTSAFWKSHLTCKAC